ncbi:unnamed protein product [Polarella glacialis]|uniref:Uncharacterized protein n=1 Tax=Polarella glacialis TaxID=89957 RepID=A0A813GCZ4_POLGL|nr:unnamed protein product [Polarella glacialis]
MTTFFAENVPVEESRERAWDQWKENMREIAAKLKFLLDNCKIYPERCKCGKNVNDFADHILGQPHSSAIWNQLDALRGSPLAQVHDFWESWQVPMHSGQIKFNHCDGMRLSAPPSGFAPQPAQTDEELPPPPPSQPPPPLQPPPPPEPQVSSAPSQAQTQPAQPDSFCMQLGDTAEALIRGSWVRVTLQERQMQNQERCWVVEEFWGGQRHMLELRHVKRWQEGLPSYSFLVGQQVAVVLSSHNSSNGSNNNNNNDNNSSNNSNNNSNNHNNNNNNNNTTNNTNNNNTNNSNSNSNSNTNNTTSNNNNTNNNTNNNNITNHSHNNNTTNNNNITNHSHNNTTNNNNNTTNNTNHNNHNNTNNTNNNNHNNNNNTAPCWSGPAQLLRRELLPDGRKGWRVTVTSPSGATAEIVEPLEHVLEPSFRAA